MLGNMGWSTFAIFILTLAFPLNSNSSGLPCKEATDMSTPTAAHDSVLPRKPEPATHNYDVGAGTTDIRQLFHCRNEEVLGNCNRFPDGSHVYSTGRTDRTPAAASKTLNRLGNRGVEAGSDLTATNTTPNTVRRKFKSPKKPPKIGAGGAGCDSCNCNCTRIASSPAAQKATRRQTSLGKPGEIPAVEEHEEDNLGRRVVGNARRQCLPCNDDFCRLHCATSEGSNCAKLPKTLVGMAIGMGLVAILAARLLHT
ncbi:hypothetical protein B0T21DRAFT_394763 [Apiosordaria backusii]|uniref:Uncharacterized protein n=1 Tax=Apiosordaria backusii TaxID=314023 RepID=A0AA40B230_9PEZI|nr:hypothetical protein B0T21DRAFT_394763 [Apiosordaria backusii]